MCVLGVSLLSAPDKGDGGPTRAELLELLHNCDASCGTSSLVSSQAPSPSPSLLSLAFPAYGKAAASSQQGGGASLAPPTLSMSASNIFRLAGGKVDVAEGIAASCSNLSLSVAPPPLAEEVPRPELLPQRHGLHPEENGDEVNVCSFQSGGGKMAAQDLDGSPTSELPNKMAAQRLERVALSRHGSPTSELPNKMAAQRPDRVALSRHGSPTSELPGDGRPASSSSNSDATVTPGGASQGPSSSCSSPQRSSPVPHREAEQVDQASDSPLQHSTEC